jgi:hypothetical protein
VSDQHGLTSLDATDHTTTRPDAALCFLTTSFRPRMGRFVGRACHRDTRMPGSKVHLTIATGTDLSCGHSTFSRTGDSDLVMRSACPPKGKAS